MGEKYRSRKRMRMEKKLKKVVNTAEVKKKKNGERLLGLGKENNKNQE